MKLHSTNTPKWDDNFLKIMWFGYYLNHIWDENSLIHMIWILIRKYEMDVNWNMRDIANNEHLRGTTSREGDNKTKP